MLKEQYSLLQKNMKILRIMFFSFSEFLSNRKLVPTEPIENKKQYTFRSCHLTSQLRLPTYILQPIAVG